MMASRGVLLYNHVIATCHTDPHTGTGSQLRGEMLACSNREADQA